MIYTYRGLHKDTEVVGEIFARRIEVPDEYGKVIRALRTKFDDASYITLYCEHGTLQHELEKRNPDIMREKGKRAKVIHKMLNRHT